MFTTIGFNNGKKATGSKEEDNRLLLHKKSRINQNSSTAYASWLQTKKFGTVMEAIDDGHKANVQKNQLYKRSRSD